MIKYILKKWLFVDERQALENAAIRVQKSLLDHMQSEKDAKEKFLANFSPKDYVMQKMSGFDYRLVKAAKVGVNQATGEAVVSNDIYEAAKKVGISEEQLLANAAMISKNDVFQFLIEYFATNQILTTFFTSPTDEAMNFGRSFTGAYINFRDEVDHLRTISEEKTKKPEDFDVHAVV